MNTKLHKSTKDKMISGVCGGLGEYLNIDSSIIRIIWVVASFANGLGILLYILASIILPYEENDEREEVKENNDSEEIVNHDPRKTMGIIIILIGIFFLIREFTPFVYSGYVWPILLIALGVLIITKGGKKNHEEQ